MTIRGIDNRLAISARAKQKGGFRPVSHREGAHQGRDEELCRRCGDRQMVGDFLVREAIRDEDENVSLAERQPSEPSGLRRAGRLAGAVIAYP